MTGVKERTSQSLKHKCFKGCLNNAGLCWGRGRLARDKEGNGKLNPVIVQRFLERYDNSHYLGRFVARLLAIETCRPHVSIANTPSCACLCARRFRRRSHSRQNAGSQLIAISIIRNRCTIIAICLEYRTRRIIIKTTIVIFD